ncbi:hypothetical protein [Clostridium sp.]|uniref:hypothetical protein n=1 Tax=Clostridium sp. TaxID=1506 RepID=UPI00290AC095|nr:hypothetical protein [Clostridium sp.]MDU5107270.1 hypothetical protein [Clostridium sp.]
MSRKMKDSGVEWIGKIPETWKISKVKRGFIRKNTKAMIDNPTILSLTSRGVKIRDITNNEGQIAESYYNYNPVSIGDLLLNPMDLVSNAFSSVSEIEGVISPAYVNIKALNKYYVKYYDYYFKLQYWGLSFFAHGKGVSYENRWTLNNETLMNYPIPYPVEEEQILISNYLDKKVFQIDNIISKQKSLIEKYKAYKQSLITETVTKGLNKNVPMKDSGIEWIGEIPSHWEIRKVKNGFIRKLSKAMADNPTILSLTASGVKVRDITNNQGQIAESYYNYNPVSIGDLLLNPMDLVSNAFSSISQIEGVISPAYINLKNLKGYNSNYYDYYFKLQYWGLTFFAHGKGVSYENRWTLNNETLMNYIIPYPPEKEQRDIALYLNNKCNKIDRVVEKKEKIIEYLQEYKKSLIYECVTGKREVN